MKVNILETVEGKLALLQGEKIRFYRNSIRNNRLIGKFALQIYRNYIELKCRFLRKHVIDKISKIAKRQNGGEIIKWNNSKYQVLHNGNKVKCGEGLQAFNRNILRILKGFYEPEEEFCFYELLKTLPDDLVMIELGSNWAVFSMWAKKEKKKAKIILVEPIEELLKLGKHHFKVNNLMDREVHFLQAYIGHENRTIEGVPVERILNVSVEKLFKVYELDKIDLLHSDIQGYEYDMLMGSLWLLERDLINILFISTHGDMIHDKCYSLVKRYNYECVCNIYRKQALTTDGLLVFVNREVM